MLALRTVTGTPHEMGAALGELFAERLRSLVPACEGRLRDYEVYTFVRTIRKKLAAEYPDVLEEIAGRAAGAGVSADAMLLLMSPEYNGTMDGCTDAYVKDAAGRAMFSHNEDNVGCDPGCYALVKYDYGDSWTVSYTIADKPAGCCFSWNSRGLLVSCNFLRTDGYRLSEPSRYIMVRKVIDCGSIAEALDYLISHPSASPFSLNLLERDSDRVVNVEKDLNNLYVHELEERYGRSNHFLLRGGEVPRTENSMFRFRKINEALASMDRETVRARDLEEALGYSESDIERCVYKDYRRFRETGRSVTVANCSYDGESGIVSVRDFVADDRGSWKWKET